MRVLKSHKYFFEKEKPSKNRGLNNLQPFLNFSSYILNIHFDVLNQYEYNYDELYFKKRIAKSFKLEDHLIEEDYDYETV